MLRKGTLVAIGMSAIGVAVVSTQALAQSFTKPIKIVTSSATSVGDNFARLIGPKLGERLGQPIVVDNRSSAGGGRPTIMAGAQLPPDGHGYLITPTPSLTLTPHVTKDVGFDPNKDFVPVGLLGSLVMALGVSASEPIKSVDELVAAAKARPGQLNYGSFGTSSPQNLAMHSFLHNRSLSMVQVAYKGGSQAMTDLISGRIAAMVSAVNQLIPLSQGGKVRILAVGGERRLPAAPDAPTTRELGVTEIDNLWMAMLAPAGTPAQYVARMNNEVNAILALPEIQETLAKQGLAANTSGPAELAAFLKRDADYWRKLVATAGVVPE